MNFGATSSNRARGGIASTVSLAWPILFGSAAMAVLEFSERIFLGRYSESALAASLPGSMMASTFTVVLTSAIGYSSTFVAQFHGAGRMENAASALFQGLWLAAFSTPLFLALIPLGRLFVTLAGHAPVVRNNEYTFFIFYVFVGIASTFSTVLGGYFSGQGRTRLVGFATAAGCGFALVLNPILIFALDLGIAGAGIAAVSAFVLSAAILAVRAARDPHVRNILGTKFASFRPQLARRILKFGLPIGISLLVANGTFALFISAFGRFGAETLALGNACFAIHGLIFNVVCAIAAAALINVGQFAGRHDLSALHRSIRSAIGLAVGVTLVFFALLLPFTGPVLSAFGFPPGDATFATGLLFLALMTARDTMESIQQILTSGLRGVGDTRFVLATRLGVSGLIWTPLFLFAAHSNSPLLAWASMPIAFATHGLVLFLRYRSHRWTTIKLTE